ncbi:MAG: site-2 protease family protein [Actinomycetota bacterium]
MSKTSVEPTGTRRAQQRRASSDGIMSSSFRILRVRGISIGAHWSWLFVFGLVSWSLASELFPTTYPELSDGSYLAMGIAASVLFFGSIVLHELGHAFRALREGMKVGDITLWLFGGVARFEGMFPTPGAEFRVAIAGPVVSLILAILFALGAWAGALADAPGQIRGVLEYLARINAAVLAFNLVPALPLDGGRVLRSWLWKRQNSFTAATVSAARAGKGFAYLLMTIGVLGFFTQAVTGGIWMVFLSFFILQAAEAEVQYALVSRTFQRFRVRDLMTPDPVTVTPDTSVEQFLDIARARGFSTYPVAEQGELRGLASVREVGKMTGEDRLSRPIGQVMMARDQVPVLDPGAPVMDALSSLRAGPGRAVVLDNSLVVGILSVSDIAKTLELEQARGAATEPAVRQAGVLVWVVVFLLMALAAAAFYRPPLAVISPAPAIDISGDISIEGIETQPINGKYLLLAVRIDQPNLLGTLIAMVSPGNEVIPISSVMPEGLSTSQYMREQIDLFEESRLLAAAAAAEAAGMEVTISGSGVEVVGVLPGSPAREVLEEGDVIVSVDGAQVQLATDLRQMVSTRPPGTSFTFEVERDASRREVQIRSARLGPRGQSPPGVGVFIETRDFEVDLPFQIEFEERDVGGPSAGLAYALAIADLLDQADYAAGRTIAASGTVSVDGSVGPVGGLEQKAAAAGDKDADLLLVPQEEIASMRGNGVPQRGVGSVREAASVLQSGS